MKNQLTESDLTFLDDVPDNEVTAFLNMVEMDLEEGFDVPAWWAFSNGAKVKTGPELLRFRAEKYSEIADYFRYILSLGKS